MSEMKKAGLLGGALVGAFASTAAMAQEMSSEDITVMVNDMVAEGISGMSVSAGGGFSAAGAVDVGGFSQIGSDSGVAIADASGGDHNVSFVS
ncbi:MAG: hypothetical protein ACKOCK_05485 [Chloroflexota bacterium]